MSDQCFYHLLSYLASSCNLIMTMLFCSIVRQDTTQWILIDIINIVTKLSVMLLQDLNNQPDPHHQVQLTNRMNRHRAEFNEYKLQLEGNAQSEIDLKKLVRDKEEIIKDLQEFQNNQNDFVNFEELTFYQERYVELERYLKGMIHGQLASQAQRQEIIRNFQKQYRLSASTEFPGVNTFLDKAKAKSSKLLSNDGSEISMSNPLTKGVFEFFEKKQKQVQNVGFKSLIIQKQKSQSRLSRKIPKRPKHDVEVRKLLEENKRLHQMFEKKQNQELELNEFERNVLKQEKQCCLERIQELEGEIEQLERNNFRYKQLEKTKKSAYQDSVSLEESYQLNAALKPYIVPVRHNDLGKLTSKNFKKTKENEIRNKSDIFFEMVGDIPSIQKHEPSFQAGERGDKFQLNSSNSGLFLENLLEVKQSPNEKTQGNFDSFSLAQTAYQNSSMFLNASKNLIAIDSVTATRNKVAFLKNSLVIVRDQEIEIAFKKSNLDANMSKIRLIFYLNNRRSLRTPVRIQYNCEQSHYHLEIVEQLREVGGNAQGREVIEVSLTAHSPDLNSVIDAHFIIGERKYDLWVPACFIVWVPESLSDSEEKTSMIIQPDRQFKSYQQMAKLIPLTNKQRVSNDETQAQAHCYSRFGHHQVTLSWWQKQLTVESGDKLLDFISFIFHHFK